MNAIVQFAIGAALLRGGQRPRLAHELVNVA